MSYKLVEFLWSLLTINKYKVLSACRGNPHNRYTIINEALIGSDYAKDLRVRVSSGLSLRKQCIEARNKTNKVPD